MLEKVSLCLPTKVLQSLCGNITAAEFLKYVFLALLNHKLLVPLYSRQGRLFCSVVAEPNNGLETGFKGTQDKSPHLSFVDQGCGCTEGLKKIQQRRKQRSACTTESLKP